MKFIGRLDLESWTEQRKAARKLAPRAQRILTERAWTAPTKYARPDNVLVSQLPRMAARESGQLVDVRGWKCQWAVYSPMKAWPVRTLTLLDLFHEQTKKHSEHFQNLTRLLQSSSAVHSFHCKYSHACPTTDPQRSTTKRKQTADAPNTILSQPALGVSTPPPGQPT